MRVREFFVSVLFILGGLFALQAQGDLPKGPIVIKGLEKEKEGESQNNLNMANSLELLKTPQTGTAPQNSALDLANKEVDMLNSEVFLDPGERFKKKAPATANEESSRGGATTTQFLGDFETETKFVKIVCRDHQAIDGDRVRILINDKVVQPNIFLDATFKGFVVELSPGFNKIDFQALNQGASGPNTAAFAIFGEKGELISANEWNLATGVKATLVVVQKTP